jgi:very-short-patch-repair endonuclease
MKQAKELGVGPIGDFMDELARACAEPGLVRESDIESMHDDVPVQQFENLGHLFAKCDSKPERLLLDALVKRAGLKLDGARLAGDLILHVQPRLGKFRVDFLVNEELVVEIDGHAFHGDKRSFEVDRLRDQELILRGLRVIRFPAKQVFLNPNDVADIVIKAATSSKGR